MTEIVACKIVVSAFALGMLIGAFIGAFVSVCMIKEIVEHKSRRKHVRKNVGFHREQAIRHNDHIRWDLYR